MFKMNPKRIGERLSELRGDREQKVVAEAVGVSVSALSMYESGERVPRDDVKIALAHYYKTTVQSLFFS